MKRAPLLLLLTFLVGCPQQAHYGGRDRENEEAKKVGLTVPGSAYDDPPGPAGVAPALAVIGAMQAIAMLDIPLHVVGLIPAAWVATHVVLPAYAASMTAFIAF